MISLFLALVAHASPVPCQFAASIANSLNGYDLGKAYQASFLVVVARANSFIQDKPQTVRVIRVIKGPPSLKEITLEGNHLNGTDSWGAAITPARDTMLLLAGDKQYHWVDGGSGCPNSFEAEKGLVKFGDRKIKIEDVKKFLEGSPKL